MIHGTPITICIRTMILQVKKTDDNHSTLPYGNVHMILTQLIVQTSQRFDYSI